MKNAIYFQLPNYSLYNKKRVAKLFYFLNYSPTNGNNAMFLARLIATVNSR